MLRILNAIWALSNSLWTRSSAIANVVRRCNCGISYASTTSPAVFGHGGDLIASEHHTGHYPGIVINLVGDMISGGLHPELLKTDELEYDINIMGHWHQELLLPRAIVCNTLKGFDEYARLQLGAKPTKPSQPLWFVHPVHGITARWSVQSRRLD